MYGKKNLSKRNVAVLCRQMALEAADPSYAAGLRAAADLLDGGEGAELHTCKLPTTGTRYQCGGCGMTWHFFYRQTARNLVGEWAPAVRRKAAS
jgi:hypothetical protein